MKLFWINDSITQGEHNNLMHNAYYAAEVVAKSLQRANALEAVKQAHDAGYMTDASHRDALKYILEKEGFQIDFINKEEA